jgi:hypothetical protein
MGAQSFQQGWASKLDKFSTVYVCFDPDAVVKAREVAGYFVHRGRVVQLPFKADDFFVRYEGTAEKFHRYLEMAWRVQT